jgi:hypothetical protein
MTSTDHGENANYEVGYGRPPLHTRFQKGHSGNPKGKVQGQKNLKTELLKELKSKVPVTEGGRRQLLSKQSIIVKRMVSDAAKGDARAREQLLRLLGEIERVQPPVAVDDPIGKAKDAEILAQFKLELLRNLKPNTQGGSDD